MRFMYDFLMKRLYPLSTIALSSTVYIDVDNAGNPIGMEILRVDSSIFATLKDLPDSATLKDLIQHAA